MAIKLCFPLMHGDCWTVGPVYLKNLIYLLDNYCRGKIEGFLFVEEDNDKAKHDLAFIGCSKVIYKKNVKRLSLVGLSDYLAKKFFSYNLLDQATLEKNKIDIFFGKSYFYKFRGIKTISYFPDFQHIYLPQMYANNELCQINNLCQLIAKNADCVLVPSPVVKDDFSKIFPQYKDKAKAWHPLSVISPDFYNGDVLGVLKAYNLPEKFIYFPSQFWKHKNHELVFKAVKFLKDQGLRITIVCSGNTYEYRDFNYFARLWQKVSTWDLKEEIIYLGLLPHEDVLTLMRQSIAVLNPSLFEGWAVTVDEARTIGKQLILSDIAVHRQHELKKVLFFDPCNYKDLADKLSQLWYTIMPGPDLTLEEEAKQQFPKRLKDSAQDFLDIIYKL